MNHKLKNAESLLQKFCDTYNEQDKDAILELFVRGSIVIGTALDEIRVGIQAMKEQLERELKQAKAQIHIVSFLPAPTEGFWASAICKAVITADGKTESFDNLRITMIVEKIGQALKIAHMHASFPDMRSPEGYSFPKNVNAK
jgi:ketosteroid isomerase-like protein